MPALILLVLTLLPAAALATDWSLVIHGGAGNVVPERYTEAEQAAHEADLQQALAAGGAILEKGGAAADAVVAAILVLEDSPRFNAGHGAVFTHDGRNEMDAAIMLGADLDAGAVSGVTTVRNPILAARAVMENSPHVMLSGTGADRFAADQGLAIEDPGYFRTPQRWQQLQKARSSEQTMLQHSDGKFGTVGAVARDQQGNLAAGTSTGGMTNKRWGRIGDAPVIGAGTYADNSSCAVSATGHGEFFIRFTVARDICFGVQHRGRSLQQAAEDVIHGPMAKAGGEGGIIAVDAAGNTVMVFNSAGMFRGELRSGSRPQVAMFGPAD